MSAQEFLTKERTYWNGLPDDALVECSDEEQESIRMIEAAMIEDQFAALSDIILNCHNKHQFAKTYKVLRADIPNAVSEVTSADAPPHVRKVIRAVVEKILGRKLSAMAHWFCIRFADERDVSRIHDAGKMRLENAIEVYAGKEGSTGATTGCAASLLVAILFLGTWIFAGFLHV